MQQRTRTAATDVLAHGGRRALTAAVLPALAVATVAWLLTARSSAMDVVGAGAFVSAWVVMMVAMMLPAVAPVAGLYVLAARRRIVAAVPETTDEQVGALSQIYTGQLGGMPWEILGTTFEVVGLAKAPITISGDGLDISLSVGGLGKASGRYFANPVTGERHEAHIVLPDGFIWSKGECGVGSFTLEAEGLSLGFDDSSWILYDFDWSNA